MDALLKEFLTETVYLSTQSTVNSYGKRTFSSGVAYAARLVYEDRLIRKADGRDILETGRAIIDGNPEVTNNSKILLPDGTTPVITSVSQVKDEFGSGHHVVVGFG